MENLLGKCKARVEIKYAIILPSLSKRLGNRPFVGTLWRRIRLVWSRYGYFARLAKIRTKLAWYLDLFGTPWLQISEFGRPTVRILAKSTCSRSTKPDRTPTRTKKGTTEHRDPTRTPPSKRFTEYNNDCTSAFQFFFTFLTHWMPFVRHATKQQHYTDISIKITTIPESIGVNNRKKSTQTLIHFYKIQARIR